MYVCHIYTYIYMYATYIYITISYMYAIYIYIRRWHVEHHKAHHLCHRHASYMMYDVWCVWCSTSVIIHHMCRDMIQVYVCHTSCMMYDARRLSSTYMTYITYVYLYHVSTHMTYDVNVHLFHVCTIHMLYIYDIYHMRIPVSCMWDT